MKTHTLSQDEDLFFLAEYYYGDAALWDIIYYANRDLSACSAQAGTIGDDPENLYPGMKLTIPSLEISDKTLPITETTTR